MSEKKTKQNETITSHFRFPLPEGYAEKAIQQRLAEDGMKVKVVGVIGGKTVSVDCYPAFVEELK